MTIVAKADIKSGTMKLPMQLELQYLHVFQPRGISVDSIDKRARSPKLAQSLALACRAEAARIFALFLVSDEPSSYVNANGRCYVAGGLHSRMSVAFSISTDVHRYASCVDLV